MQKWLNDNDILIYLTYHEGKSVVAERFIKTLKDKIYKKNTANDDRPYLSYSNKLVDKYNNHHYQHSIGRKPINDDYLDLPEKTETNSKSPKFKVGDIVRITIEKNIFSKKKLVKRNICY